MANNMADGMVSGLGALAHIGYSALKERHEKKEYEKKSEFEKSVDYHMGIGYDRKLAEEAASRHVESKKAVKKYVDNLLAYQAQTDEYGRTEMQRYKAWKKEMERIEDLYTYGEITDEETSYLVEKNFEKNGKFNDGRYMAKERFSMQIEYRETWRFIPDWLLY